MKNIVIIILILFINCSCATKALWEKTDPDKYVIVKYTEITAVERGINFCSECDEYPCADLKKFQSSMPHRIELWDNLARIKSYGYEEWLREIRENYICPQCQTINSTYDQTCRKCGRNPSCNYVAKHKQVIEEYLNRK